MVYVVKTADSTQGQRFIAAADSLLRSGPGQRVAFDCEGVNLSRVGSLELVSICFPSMEVYLVDFGGTPCPRVVKSVKDLFESDAVTKIIHDCRMDCDAMYHLHGIRVNNVHDTSCFHDVITGTENKNLNVVLTYNGIHVNAQRDKSVYKYNPRYWSTRPLTQTMISWASSDVDKLFTLADKQLERISDMLKPRALAKSTEYTQTTLGMQVVTGLKVRNPGLFIGRGGQNLRSLSRRTQTHIYQNQSEGSWFVFYMNEASLNAVKSRMAM